MTTTPALSLAQRLQAVRERIASAEARAGRPAGSVHLLAVSKAFSAPVLAQALDLGLRAFGENYAQEAQAKMQALAALRAGSGHPVATPQWHFIGPLQSNKTRIVAGQFQWLHSLDRPELAARLSRQRAPSAPELQVLVEVRLSPDEGRSGVAPELLAPLLDAVAPLPGLCLRGLMGMPAADAGATETGRQFARLRQLHERLRPHLPRPACFDTLSMGMSADLEIAIAEGSTLVRVGSAIFGPRAAHPAGP